MAEKTPRMEQVILHIGCGRKIIDGFINTDVDMDITKHWPYDGGYVSGIVSMQVFQQIDWRGLMVALREAYRVLEVGGVMRFGTMLVDDNEPEYALGWKNINLFSFDLLKRVLEQVGFRDVEIKKFKESRMPILTKADNRPVGKGTTYIECVK